VARLVPKKGFLLAIQTCAILKKNGLKFHYDIVGGGEQYAELDNLINNLNVTDCVVLHGPKNNDEIISMYQEAALFFMPCIQMPNGDMDGIPVAMMEAMACQVPVVSSSISAIPELVINNQTGWVSPGSDPEEYAMILGKVLYDSKTLDYVGRNARELILREFDIDKNAAEFRKVISKNVFGSNVI
jgi:colanic acid/amylovoran biosynthesis glycosyltransferase